jgi:hypothetical protein
MDATLECKVFCVKITKNGTNNYEKDESMTSRMKVEVIHCGVCYPPFLGITKEMMSRGPHVVDMEYREAYQHTKPFTHHISPSD